MGEYIARNKEGTLVLFDIAGDKPDAKEAARINASLQGLPRPPVDPLPKKEPEGPGLLDVGKSFGTGIARGWNTTQSAYYRAQQMAAEKSGDTESAKEYARLAEGELAERDTYDSRKGLFDEETKMGKAASIAQTIGESALPMAVSTGATIGGGMLGGIPGAVGGFALSTAAYAPQSFSGNVERQIEQHGQVKDWNKAMLATAGQAGLEATVDRVTLGAAGLLKRGYQVGAKAVTGKAIESAAEKEAREIAQAAVDKATTFVIKRIGKTAGVGAVTGAAEEVLQQGLERWQADMAVLPDEKSKREYLESAITGGIIEGIFGGGAGYVGARSDIKDERARKAAKEDADAEAAALGKAFQENVPANQALREADWESKNAPDSPAPIDPDPPHNPETVLKIPDFSAETREQKLLDKDETHLPPGLRDDYVTEPLGPPTREGVTPQPVLPKTETGQGPLFTESEYRSAIDAMRDEKFVSVPKIAKKMKADTSKAEAIFKQMLDRNDGYPAGGQNQYLKVTVPRGMPTRTGSHMRGEIDPNRRARDFAVKRVIPAGVKPFTVHLNGKKRGNNKFASRAEAQAWIDRAIPEGKKKDATVQEDFDGQQFGIYEQHYDRVGTAEQLVGEKVVNTYKTEQEAKDAIGKYDPAYSGYSNSFRETPTPEQKEMEIQQDMATNLGEMAEILREGAERIVGPGRVDVGVAPTIAGPTETSVVEGATLRNKVKQLILLAADLYNPNLSPEQRLQKMQEVLNHELIHAIRQLNLMTRAEWNTLTNALQQKVPGKPYTWAQLAEARRSDLVKEGRWNALEEEAVAEMFRAYLKDPSSFRDQEVKGIFKRLAAFIKKLIGLGKRHSAEDLMDAIFKGELATRKEDYGGKKMRNRDDVHYSLLEPDNFYLGTTRFLDGITTTPERTPREWLNALSSSGIKKEELDWLAMRQWLQEQPKNTTIHKNDLYNYAVASGPKITTIIRSDSFDDAEYGKHTVDFPMWSHKSQKEPGQKYAEVALVIPGIKGEPDFKGGVHFEAPATNVKTQRRESVAVRNVLAFARLRTVWDGAKKLLFIEEIQSDLHQKGSMNGYYSQSNENRKAEVAKQIETSEARIGELRMERQKLQDQSWMISRMRSEAEGRGQTDEIARLIDKIAEVNNQIFQNSEQRDATEANIKLMRKEHVKLVERSGIPNAPFKTNWEDYVIRRLIRHAADNGYDGVMWHGNAESVADTEGYDDFSTDVDPQSGKTSYFADADKQYPLTPIVNRYLVKLPKIVRQLMEPFGVVLEQNKGREKKNTGNDRITKYGNYDPENITPDKIRNRFPSRESFSEFHDQLKNLKYWMSGRYYTANDAQLADGIARMMEKAQNHAFEKMDAYNWDADILMEETRFPMPVLARALQWVETGDFYGNTVNTDEDADAPVKYEHYRVNFNSEVREAFERGDIPMFSKIEARSDHIRANPNFRIWFEGSVVTDDDGTAKVMYHGTRADTIFDRFNRLSHFGTAQAANDRLESLEVLEGTGWSIGERLGIPPERISEWWRGLDQNRRDELMSEQWRLIDLERANSRIYPAFLNLRRPLKIRDSGENHSFTTYLDAAWKADGLTAKEVLSFEPMSDAGMSEQEMLGRLVQLLEKKGYDGFSYRNTREDSGSETYVTFRPEQAKSLFNRGTFDPMDPRVDYSMIELRGKQLWESDDKFKHWFGGSRVTKENGDPYLMFTGTSKDQIFTKFKAPKNGIWFTGDPKAASQYAVENDSMGFKPNSRTGQYEPVNQTSRVIPAFLSIKNPMKWNDLPEADKVRWTNATNYRKQQGELFDRLKREGYDGFVLDDENIWVAFAGDQVKSAFNTEFSKEDPRFSMIETAPQYSASAPMGQRVPLHPGLDRLAEVENQTTYNVLAPKMKSLFNMAGMKHVGKLFGQDEDFPDAVSERSIIMLQDRMQPLAKLIDMVRRNGGYIVTGDDAYLQEALFSGKTKAHLERNQRDYYEKLATQIGKLKVTEKDAKEVSTLNDAADKIINNKNYAKLSWGHKLVELYLYAQHAQERNTEMRRRNAKVFLKTGERDVQYDRGSGMSDTEAQEILNWFDAKSFGKSFNDSLNPNSVRSLYRALVKNTNDVRVEAGLTPDFRVMHWEDGSKVDPYLDYAPLRGSSIDNNPDFDEDFTNSFARIGRGFNIRGKEDQTAMGRQDLGVHLFANAVLQNQEAVVRAEKNKMNQAFYRFVEKNSALVNQSAEILHTPRTKWTFNRTTQSVTRTKDTAHNNDPTVLKLKIDGQQRYIKLKDEKLIKALTTKNGLGDTGANIFINGLQRLNRYLAAINTSYNPEFLISNGLMDFTNALTNLNEGQKKAVIGRVTGSVRKAITGIGKYEFSNGTSTDPMAREFQEFQNMGGRIAYYGQQDLTRALEVINKELARPTDSNPINYGRKAIKKIGEIVEKANAGIENGVRLATYVALRDHYLSLTNDPTNPANIRRAKEMAAFAAKELTVNFNRKGEAGQFLNSIYLFFNASLQGSAALLIPFARSKRVRAIFASAVATGFMMELLNAWVSPEDDDGEKTYDKLPGYKLDRNIVLRDPTGMSESGFITIPMPHLLGGVYNLGRHAARSLRGKESAPEAAMAGMGGLLESLNPLGSFNSWLNFVAPTIIDPGVDLVLNENFVGNPIMPNASPFGESEIDSQRYWDNTSPLAISVADWTSRITNAAVGYERGDYLSGGVEVSPNQIAYFADWMTGGAGGFLDRFSQAAVPALRKEDYGIEDVPFARRLFVRVTDRNELENYIKGRDEVMLVRKELKDAQKDGDSERYNRIMRNHPEEYRASITINKIENARKKLAQKKKKIKESPNLSEEHKKQLLDQIKEQQKRYVERGNSILTQMEID